MGSNSGKSLFGEITNFKPILEEIVKPFAKFELGHMEHFEIIKPKIEASPTKKELKVHCRCWR